MNAPEQLPQVEHATLAAAERTLSEAAGGSLALDFAEALRAGDAAIHQAYQDGASAAVLVHARCTLVDELIRRAWHEWVDDQAGGVALVAVGGYGRGELLPHSDIDLLVLLDEEPGDSYTPAIQDLFSSRLATTSSTTPRTSSNPISRKAREGCATSR